ncbi:ATP-binding protein [Nonomuraea sp. LPB2021202275-12-8]|uniref:ATP-binding protein n=1 Tax=Nonomuraea sp. LPB2021202275-12-8 TaxID=3120159 RepID=UPI00300D4DFA
MAFVGRVAPLRRIADALRDAGAGRAELVLVTGESGIGKTALAGRAAEDAARDGWRTVWATCWDGAPALWPWAQVVRAVVDDHDVDPGEELGRLVPGLPAPVAAEQDDLARLRLFDAVARLLERAAPLLVVIDDLHWADPSSLRLLEFVAGAHRTAPLTVVAVYRPDELAAGGLASVATRAQAVHLGGLDAAETTELVAQLAGERAAREWGEPVFRRAGGHPFFTRELAHALASGGGGAGVPAVVGEVIARRVSRLTPACAAMLEVAAVAGVELRLDLLSEVMELEPGQAADLVAEACGAGILLAGPRPRFAHDLYRESIGRTLAPARLRSLHHALGVGLTDRTAVPAEIARHLALAMPQGDIRQVTRWALTAAKADSARLAFAEAAAQAERVLDQAEAAGCPLPADDRVDLLVAAGDARLRAGEAAAARQHLDSAWSIATGLGDPARQGAVALALTGLGARFAMPRTVLVNALDQAYRASEGTATAIEARLAAALARELQHSVPRERPRARPLAERAVRIARDLDDPATLATCLLARHDTIWTPGTQAERIEIAAEIATLATDQERHAEAWLLLASAQLEDGSPAFRATLAEYFEAATALRQPRHDYLVLTRRAALALLDGDLAGGERLVHEAAELGDRLGEPDTGNVRMSQLLEVVRAGGEPDRLRALAAEAVRWWVGAPVHAHAVAAGFLARAGDLDSARREVDTVLALGGWQADRSYLWSVYIGELAEAAIRLGDTRLCERLLAELAPVAGGCAVNGALVCFMGAHAQRIGRLHAALGDAGQARTWLERAAETHRRLGATLWEADHPVTSGHVTLRRSGELWLIQYGGRAAHLRDAKGLRDLATLTSRPGVPVHVLDLTGPIAPPPAATQPVLDRAAVTAYRSRLADLEAELADAGDCHDGGRLERASEERESILAELREHVAPGGGIRAFRAAEVERARKAVAGRVRDSIRRISEVLPEAGAHLDRTVRTGVHCVYDSG